MTTMTVHLVDDNDAFRQSTAWVLEAAEFLVRSYAGGAALLAALEVEAPSDDPACILTDLRMPEMNGLALMEALHQRRCGLPVIMITAHGEVPLAVEAMRRGAANFIEKPFEADALVEMIRLAVRQPPALRDLDAAGERLARLSPRETEVMKLVCAGKLNKTVADLLGISIKTVELHRANMMTKLGVHNVQELIRITLGYR